MFVSQGQNLRFGGTGRNDNVRCSHYALVQSTSSLSDHDYGSGWKIIRRLLKDCFMLLGIERLAFRFDRFAVVGRQDIA